MSASNLIEPVGPLSLKSYLNEIGEHQDWPIPRQRFVDYGSWVQRSGVPDVDARTVTGVERAGPGFRLNLDDGESLTASRVVVAGGIEQMKYIPAGFDHLPSHQVSHTGDHHDLAKFAGQRVAIIGGGQSAFECAALMHERGAARVEVLTRSTEVVWLRSYSPKTLMGPVGPIVYAPTDVGPLWYSRLVANPELFRLLPREVQHKIAYRSIRPACSYFVKVRLDEISVTLGVEVRDARASEGGLRIGLSDGSSREIDHLMFGTGYRFDLERYAFLGERVRRSVRRYDGYPLLGRGLESSVPRLHFAGAAAAWSFGPILRFVSGSWYAGHSLAHVAGAGKSRAFAPSGAR